jgi:hypothetical protein
MSNRLNILITRLNSGFRRSRTQHSNISTVGEIARTCFHVSQTDSCRPAEHDSELSLRVCS